MNNDLNIEQAQKIILENISHLALELVPVTGAIDRVLGEDITAPGNLPGDIQSAVDGFALGDARKPVNSRFTLKGFLQPGEHSMMALVSGEAMGVMTGGTLPAGTGAVVPHEKAKIEGEALTALEEIKPGSNIKQPGEDFCQGETLGRRGTVLDPGYISLFAAIGVDTIPVFKIPRVAILSLGKNVIAHTQTPLTGQIRDSNGPLLAALIKRAGGRVIASKLTRQHEADRALLVLPQLIRHSDLVITTGGTYAERQGEARELLESMNAEIKYWGTDVQPGSHNGFALCNDIPVFSISGNPAACAVGFHLLAAPALHYLQGKEFSLRKVEAVCTNNFPKAARSRRMVRGYASVGPRGWEVMVLPGQKPSMHRSLLNCNALIDIPPGHPPLEAGSKISVILLDGVTA